MLRSEPENAQILGHHIYEWRIVLGLQQKALAQRAGISVPALRRLERGEPTVQLGTFLAVIEVLGLMDRVAGAVNPVKTELDFMRAYILNEHSKKNSKRES